MNLAQIQAMQARINASGFLSTPLDVDGFWGPKSIAGCQHYLRRLMPTPHPWPKTDQASLTAFYGRPGDETQHTLIAPPFPMFYAGAPVRAITVHRRCAESLLAVLTDIKQRHGSDERVMTAARDYYGVYNNRSMRGGSLPSLHARAAAIDLDADDNGNHDAWPTKGDMPLEIMECFARQGWMPAGAFWSRDGMHFQATQ